MAEERSKGKVVKFIDHKGFGFIRPDESDADLFFHRTDVVSGGGYVSLQAGQEVEFLVALDGGNSSKAVDVTGPEGAPLVSGRKEGGGRGGEYGYRRNVNGGGGYRSGGARDVECYSCGESGHISRDCEMRGNNGGVRGGGFGGVGRDGACYNCGGLGHLARDCPSPSERRTGGGGGSGAGACYTCGKQGHFSRDCPEKDSRGGYDSYGSGGGRSSGGGKGCFECGKEGHIARECPNRS
ncbi:hypothetical protein RJ639_042973 [Escallonia herrerae]|uniref:Uncharacterized protein n=1 Tax=Escallonia herrerae TaxID=1293975 RepID=A0AA88WBA2_9ASTE|nr:hypothetical protein RJ639_042973 [Escallonia herrerae]